MGLDWSTSRCDEPLPKDADEAAVRTGLVWACMGLDLGGITKKNVDEWVWRLLHQHYLGMELFYFRDEPTPDEVEAMVSRWIGLGTNVSTKPRKEWLKRVSQIQERITDGKIRYARSQNQAQHA